MDTDQSPGNVRPARSPADAISTKLPSAAESDAALLARLGYKQELKRVFTATETFGLAFSVISPFPAIV